MSQDYIPEDVEQFILKYIDSVAQLEALLLLRRDQETLWNVEILAQRLYIGQQETKEILIRLHNDGLIAKRSKPRSYKFQPGSPELQQMTDRLADIYSRYLIPVTKLIHSKPKSRVREFADAFKLRREE